MLHTNCFAFLISSVLFFPVPVLDFHDLSFALWVLSFPPSLHITLVCFPLARHFLYLFLKKQSRSLDSCSVLWVIVWLRTVHLITTKDGWEQKLAEAAKEGKIVVANFSATWCGPCKMIAPFYSDLSVEHRSLMFLLVDVDELTEFSTSWDIKATPTFFFLRDGQQVDKLVGANKPELQKKITAILDLLPQAKCRS